MMELMASVFLLLGAAFSLVAAIGIVRMPDLWCRMHAATKAGAFGVSLMLLALFLAMPSVRTFVQGALIIAFFYLTAPVAAHLIARVALVRRVPVWRSQETEVIVQSIDKDAPQADDQSAGQS